MALLKSIYRLFIDTYQGWQKANSPLLAAALAYYAIFSLAPLLVVALSIADLAYDQLAARQVILSNVQRIAGQQVMEAIQSILENASQTPASGLIAIISLIVLIYTASVMFVKLKLAINILWGIAPDPRRLLLLSVWSQVRSILLVFTLGLLLILFMATSTLIVTLHQVIAALPRYSLLLEYLPQADFGIVLLLFTLFFAIVFKTLPEAKISWRDVLLGAFVTGFFFTIGEFLIGFYLGKVSHASTFGAAGSLTLILIWIYLSMQIILFGAEFTLVYANRYGSGIEPAGMAVRVIRLLGESDKATK